MASFNHLFQTIRIGGLDLKNRIVMAPMFLAYGNPDGTISPMMLDHYRKIAQGGAAMIIVEHTLVDERGMASSRQIRADRDDFVPGLHNLAEVIKENGALAGIQINHAGKFARVKEPLSASAVEFHAGPNVTITPRALTPEEIKSTIDSYVQAALRVKEAGFDLVELHGGTGYLLTQFLSPRTNKRDDKYGGTLENRMSFPLEVLGSVKDAVGPDYPIGYRFLAEEWLPDGLSLQETEVFARMLERTDIAYLSVMGGTHESFMIPEIAEQSQKDGYMVHLANAIKKKVSVPVFTAGRITTPELAEEIIESGKADVVALARILFADPDWPNKAKGGRSDEIVRCIPRCDNCIGMIMEDKPAFCAMWDKESINGVKNEKCETCGNMGTFVKY